MRVIGGYVDDIEHWVTQYGNVHPVLVVGNSWLPIKNYAVMSKLNIWVGDLVRVTFGEDMVKDDVTVLHEHRSVDATPMTYPELCPCCSSVLQSDRLRPIALKCTNQDCGAKNH